MLLKYIFLGVSLLQLGTLLYASASSCSELCREVNRIVDEASRDSTLRGDAFRFLVLIAEGRGDRPSAQLASRLVLSAAITSAPANPDISLRSEAFQRMGELALPQAISYLKAFKENDFSPSDRRILWAAVQIGIHTAELEGITSNAEKHQLLESLLFNNSTPAAPGDVQSWAWNKLCDDGALAALPLIKSAMDAYYGDSRSIDAAQFCEERIRSVSGQPSQLIALQTVLTDNTWGSERLRMWALGRLIRMNSEESRNVLSAFAKWVDDLPVGHQNRAELQDLRMHLRTKRLE